MTDQNTIPAEKVRELADKYDNDGSGDPERLLVQAIADLRALLPTQQPTTGLLGRWAKHPDYGDVVCAWDKPDTDGRILVRWVDENATGAANWVYASMSSLTFPHRATKPEDVPAGEAWLVDVEYSKESHKSIVALKDSFDFWRTSDDVTSCNYWQDSEVALISPLTPERPGAAAQAQEPPNPAWRIEHDHTNLRVGEYIIDNDDDTGTVIGIDGHDYRDTDGAAYGFPGTIPFIVFPNRDAATPEAIEEAKNARDRETGE